MANDDCRRCGIGAGGGDDCEYCREPSGSTRLPASERAMVVEALEKIVAQDFWTAVDERDEVDGRCAEIARATLARLKEIGDGSY